MKKLLLILSIINSPRLICMAQTTEQTTEKNSQTFNIFGYNIDPFKAMEGVTQFAEPAIKEISRITLEAMQAEEDIKINQYKNKISDKKYEITRTYNKDKIEKLNQDIKKLKEKIKFTEQKKEEIRKKFQEEMLKNTSKALDVGAQIIQEEQKARNRYKEKVATTAVKADEMKNAILGTTDKILETLKDPKNVATISIALFGSIYGVKLLANIIEKYLNKVPAIAEETSLGSYKQKLINYLSKKKLESDISDVVLKKDISDRIEVLAHSLKNTVKNNGYFRHMLFYGPPGTGKTMLAKRLARSSGLEYIYFAGGSALDQLSIEEALCKLTELLEFAKNSSKKLMIIIDESEVLLADRSKKLSDKSRKLLNLLLGYTGTENSNFIIVALTNRPEDLDKAFLNRCDEHINISEPGLDERKAILKYYIEKLLILRTKEIKKPSFFKKLLGAVNPPDQILIKKYTFTEDYVEFIAKKLEGFVGRDILKLVIAIQSQAYASENCLITRELVDKIVDQKIAQKKASINF